MEDGQRVGHATYFVPKGAFVAGYLKQIPRPEIRPYVQSLPQIRKRTFLTPVFATHPTPSPRGGIGLSDARTSTPASVPTIPPTIPYPLSFHTLAHSFAQFCTRQKIDPFVFNGFHTLCQKQPGVGVPSEPT